MSNALFEKVAMRKPKQSTFDLTHDVKMSGKMGLLLPCLAMDILPGDKITIGADALVKLAPILAPIMHRVDLSIHYFYVPNRILWEHWEQFITGTADENGDLYQVPTITLDGNIANTPANQLADYLGISPYRTGAPNAEQVSAFPFAAYNLIYNEYYRDQNLIPELLGVELVDGNNAATNYEIQKRAWEHDYFTSCLPFAQKGAAVEIPLGEVELDPDWFSNGNIPLFNTDTPGNVANGPLEAIGLPNPTVSDGTTDVAYNPNGSLTVGTTTINDLRRAYRLQEWLEKNARGGTRYTESILVHFGVKSPDARLQRPEYITGVKSPVIVTEVLNTTGPTNYFNSETGQAVQTGSPQGDMSGHGTAMAQGRLGRYYATEHGWVIGILNVQPKTAYQQGISRMFTRKDYMDYAFPTFANLGEQEVLNREIYAYGANSEGLFGYIPRYAEYKFMNNRVAGDFRNTLDFWHLGRIFANQPTLNRQFIECDPENVERIFAVQDNTDNLWMHILHKIRAKRKLPFFGTPTI
jgi:hypothetical protein